MKTLHRIKILPLGVFTAIALTFPLLSLAAPWSEQNAFCSDKMSMSYSNYSNQKIYNECMENADALIAEHEKFVRDFVREWEKGQLERQIEWAKIEAKQAARDKALREAEKLKNEQEIKKYDDLFSEFN
jgi:hypothetical protein